MARRALTEEEKALKAEYVAAHESGDFARIDLARQNLKAAKLAIPKIKDESAPKAPRKKAEPKEAPAKKTRKKREPKAPANGAAALDTTAWSRTVNMQDEARQFIAGSPGGTAHGTVAASEPAPTSSEVAQEIKSLREAAEKVFGKGNLSALIVWIANQTVLRAAVKRDVKAAFASALAGV